MSLSRSLDDPSTSASSFLSSDAMSPTATHRYLSGRTLSPVSEHHDLMASPSSSKHSHTDHTPTASSVTAAVSSVGALDSFKIEIDGQDEFWNELEAILDIPDSPSLLQIDNTLRMCISLLSRYHDDHLTTAGEHHHALYLVLHCDLFQYHSERMISLIIAEAEKNTNPHTLYVLYHILLLYGNRHPSLFRSQRRWRRLLITLADVVVYDCEHIPHHYGPPAIESRLRLPASMLMYEVCRVQRLPPDELDEFTDEFIDKLFEVVELTRDQEDEAFNNATIRLIVALNEQFMVTSVSRSRTKTLPIAQTRRSGRPHTNSDPPAYQREDPESRPNRVMAVLLRRLNSSKTFGENVIFMLNRSNNSNEGMCLQLLILKILYLLFTTSATQEYFYTNDLRVLVDVFIRELVDLPSECESLRHTYLRVLHPLLTNTQLKSQPYKQTQIRLVLLSLISNSHIHDVSPTTKRLVERCLEISATPGSSANQSSEDVPALSASHPHLFAVGNGSTSSLSSLAHANQPRPSSPDRAPTPAGRRKPPPPPKKRGDDALAQALHEAGSRITSRRKPHEPARAEMLSEEPKPAEECLGPNGYGRKVGWTTFS